MSAVLLLTPACVRKPVPVIAPAAAPIAPPAAARVGPPSIYPDLSRTPGAANPDIRQDNIGDNICSKNWNTGLVRPPSSYTTNLKKKQIKNWNLTGTAASYEEDHLVSLEDGGHPKDERNLWPELWNFKVGTKDLGAHTKDRVEGYIHDEICFNIPNHRVNSKKYKATASVTLARGQEILANDWYACYMNMVAGQPCL